MTGIVQIVTEPPDNIYFKFDNQYYGTIPDELTVESGENYELVVYTQPQPLVYSDLIVKDNKVTRITINTDTGDIYTKYEDIVIVPPTVADITKEGFDDLNTIMTSIDSGINDLKQILNPPKPLKPYYNDETITTAVLTPQPDNLGAYQFDDIFDKQGMSRDIWVKAIGPGNLFILVNYTDTSHSWSDEIQINEGKSQKFDNVYSIGARSPTARCRYIVTERELTDDTGESFTGSRYKDRRNRKGTIVFKDDMESPTIKYVASGGGTALRSNTFAYAGDFSTKVSASLGVDESIIYTHSDFHQTRIGAQFRWLQGGTPTTFNVGIKLQFNDGKGNKFTGNVIATTSLATTMSFAFIGADGSNNVLTPGGILGLPFDLNGWNVIKLVIDTSTGTYVSAIINSFEFDLSSSQLQKTSVVVGSPVVTSTIGVSSSSVGLVPAFIDDYIFTEDEP